MSGRSSSGMDAFQLDRQVGNAAARVQSIWLRDGAGRASGHATSATAAHRFLGRIRGQFERGEDLAEEEPGAEFSIEQHGALTVPSDPRFRREIALQHRAGIDVNFLLAAMPAQEVIERAQPGEHDLVIVVAPGVARDPAGMRARPSAPSPCQ